MTLTLSQNCFLILDSNSEANKKVNNIHPMLTPKEDIMLFFVSCLKSIDIFFMMYVAYKQDPNLHFFAIFWSTFV